MLLSGFKWANDRAQAGRLNVLPSTSFVPEGEVSRLSQCPAKRDGKYLGKGQASVQPCGLNGALSYPCPLACKSRRCVFAYGKCGRATQLTNAVIPITKKA